MKPTSWRVLGFVVVTSFVGLASLAACGGDDATDNGGELDASSDEASLVDNRTGGGGDTSTDSPVIPTTCPEAPATTGSTFCTFSDQPTTTGSFLLDLAASTDATCTTRFYVLGGTNFFERKLRRYTMKTAVPCALERDNAFGELTTNAGGLAVDDKNNVYSWAGDGADNTVHRISPSPVACAIPAGIAMKKGADAIAVSRDGTVGFTGYSRFGGADAGDGLFFTKFTVSPSGACTVTSFTPTGGPPMVTLQGLAVDAKGRLHVSMGDVSTAANSNRIDIYDASGAFVSTYRKRNDAGVMQFLGPLTACPSGICVTDLFELIAVDDDGKFLRTKKTTLAPGAGINFPAFIGSPRGPVFYAGEGIVDSGVPGSQNPVHAYIVPGP